MTIPDQARTLVEEGGDRELVHSQLVLHSIPGILYDNLINLNTLIHHEVSS